MCANIQEKVRAQTKIFIEESTTNMKLPKYAKINRGQELYNDR